MAAKWIDSLPCSLLLSWPLDNGVVAWKVGHPLSTNSITSFPLNCYGFLVVCPLSQRITSCRNQDQWMTIVFYQNFLHTKIRVERLPNNLVNCLLFVRKCRSTSTWIEFLWNYLVFFLICSVNFWLCRRAATYQILWRCSIRISSALHRFRKFM